MEKIRFLGISIMALGILVNLTPHALFPVCEYFGLHAAKILAPSFKGGLFLKGGVASIPLKCYWMGWTEATVGIPLVLVGMLLLFSSRTESRRALGIMGIILGLFVILLPTFIVGTCANPTMPCNTGTKPALIILGGLVVVLSGLSFLTKERAILVPRSMRISVLINRSLRGRYLRTILTVTCIAMITGSLFTSIIFTEGINGSIKAQTNRLGADIIVVPKGYEVETQEAMLSGEPLEFYMDKSIVERVAMVPQIEKATSQLYIASLTGASCCAAWRVQLVGFDPETDFVVKPWIQDQIKTQMEKDDVFIGSQINLPVGGDTFFYGHTFKIKGQLEPIGSAMDFSVYMTLDAAYEMAAESAVKAEKTLNISPNEISAVFVEVKQGALASDVASTIELEVQGVKTITSDNIAQTVRGQVSDILQSSFIAAGVIWGMSILLIGTIFTMVVNERRREIGLFQALGATKRYIFKIIIFEAIIMALIGGVLGIVAGGMIVYFFNALIVSSISIPYIHPTFASIGLLGGLCMGLAITSGVLAASYPAFMISRLDPYEAIRRGSA